MSDPEITDPRDPYKWRDIVAELDRWLAVWPNHLAGSIDVAVIERARDEIVALRKKASRLERGLLDEWGTKLIAKARDEALEEAAHECDEEAKASSEGFRDGCETCAAAIRALKGKGPA